MPTVRELADWVAGEVVGDGSAVIARAVPLADQPGVDAVTVLFADKYLAEVQSGQAGAVVVNRKTTVNGKSMIRVDDPLSAFAAIYARMHVPAVHPLTGIHPTAVIHPTAMIGEDVGIGPHVAVGAGSVIGARTRLHAGAVVGSECRIGEDGTLHPHAVIYDGCRLGDRVILHSNVVIGSDGFGFRTIQGRHVKVEQMGIVDIGDDVEIGACTTIDRATFGATRIGSGTKIDNHVQIAHNCRIGKHNLIAAHCALAGSVRSGDYVIMAGNCGIVDHVTIGDGAILGARSGVPHDVPAGARVLGNPATAADVQLRVMSTLERLPQMRKEIRKILRHLNLDGE